MTNKNLKELEEFLVQVCIRIAKRGEGAMFVIGKANYRPLVAQTVPSFRVEDNPKLLESLALIDGAIVIDKKGFLKAYGVLIKATQVFENFGTRHSGAISASKTAELVVLVSEEDKKIRIFKKGKMILQVDPMQKGVEKSVPEAMQLLESIGAGTIGTLGTTLIAPALGIALLPGIVVFGSAYYLTKKLTKNLKKEKV